MKTFISPQMAALAVMFCIATTVASPAQTFKNLNNFATNTGAFPFPGLVQGTDGNLYGATSFGGTSHCGQPCGTLFKMSLNGTLTTLYNFGTAIGDGFNPTATLLQDTNGDFYGTTQEGGTQGTGNIF